MGGVFYFFWIPHICQSRAGFVRTRILSCNFRRMSVLKFHWEMKEEPADSRNAVELWLSSVLKDWANHPSVNLSVLIYNSTPVGFIPAPLPSKWHKGKCRSNPSMGNTDTEALLLPSLQRISGNAFSGSIPLCHLLVCVSPEQGGVISF